MNAWTCEVEINIEGEELVIEGRIESDAYDCEAQRMVVSVDNVWGCSSDGFDVPVDPIPIHWWPTIKEAILDEAESQIEAQDE